MDLQLKDKHALVIGASRDLVMQLLCFLQKKDAKSLSMDAMRRRSKPRRRKLSKRPARP